MKRMIAYVGMAALALNVQAQTNEPLDLERPIEIPPEMIEQIAAKVVAQMKQEQKVEEEKGVIGRHPVISSLVTSALIIGGSELGRSQNWWDGFFGLGDGAVGLGIGGSTDKSNAGGAFRGGDRNNNGNSTTSTDSHDTTASAASSTTATGGGGGDTTAESHTTVINGNVTIAEGGTANF